MPNEAFNYNVINLQGDEDDGIREDDIFTSNAMQHRPFVDFGLKTRALTEADQIDSTLAKFGWKLHVSIDDNNQRNLAEGWNRIKDVLIAHRVYFAKVIEKGHNPLQEERINGRIGLQAGKQITIYTFYQPTKDWGTVITDITRALAMEPPVLPSYRAPGDRPIQGSNYITYCCDGSTRHGNLFSRVDWGSEIEPDDPDKFQNIVVQVENQPPIPAWEGPPVSLDEATWDDDQCRCSNM